MTIAPGTRVGPYEITALLGQGGMGEVYRARDTRLQRDVAMSAHLGRPGESCVTGAEHAGDIQTP